MNRPQVLSLPERMPHDPIVTGKGVCMGFIDLGFYAHPDLLQPEARIRSYVDVTRERPHARDLGTPRGSAWHGTMTACSAVGSGYLSGGRYRGLASDAQAVLIKVGSGEAPRVVGKHVAAGIRVAINNPELNIKILSISLGVGKEDPAHDDVMAAVEEAHNAGVTIFAAAGNDPDEAPEAPGSSPHAITVGGVDDQNLPDPRRARPYASSHVEGPVPKPELLAPANLLPAPMLPGTLVARESHAMFDLLSILEEEAADEVFARLAGVSIPDEQCATLKSLLASVRERMRCRKYVHPDYQHVDGTSFAAPIAASVGALLLEVNPGLSPRRMKQILVGTADPLPGHSTEDGGAGMVNPLEAVKRARHR